MIKVEQLDILNVGPFNNEEFDFSIEEGNPDIHIFTGPNGTGKTTVLHSIASAFDYFEEGHKEHLSNNYYKRFHKKEKDGAQRMSASVKIFDLFNKKSIEETYSYKCNSCPYVHQLYVLEKYLDRKSGESGAEFVANYKDLETYKNAIIAKDISNQKFKFAAFGYSGYRLINSSQIKIDNDQTFNPLHLALEFVKKNDENASISNWIVSTYSKAAIEEAHGNKELAEKYRQSLSCLTNSIAELTNNEFTFEVKTNPWKVVTKYFDKEVEFDVLPDGLRSVLSWMGDLLMRLDAIPWENDTIPVNHQNIILMLDEIEVHLHPKWQYQILPLTKKLFPNAQIFLSTHSPFILNSIDNAKIYKLTTYKGVSKLDQIMLSNTGDSISYVYKNILETENKFSESTTKDIKRFEELDQEIVLENYENEEEFQEVVNRLLEEGEEVASVISSKLFRLKRVIGKDYINGKN